MVAVYSKVTNLANQFILLQFFLPLKNVWVLV